MSSSDRTGSATPLNRDSVNFSQRVSALNESHKLNKKTSHKSSSYGDSTPATISKKNKLSRDNSRNKLKIKVDF